MLVISLFLIALLCLSYDALKIINMVLVSFATGSVVWAILATKFSSSNFDLFTLSSYFITVIVTFFVVFAVDKARS